MKKLNYLFGAALVAFGATLASCSVEDNSTPDPRVKNEAELAIALAAGGTVELAPGAEIELTEALNLTTATQIVGDEANPATIITGEGGITTNNSLEISNVKIDATALKAALVALETPEAKAKKADGTESDYGLIDNLSLTNVEISGLTQPLIKGKGKIVFDKIIIENDIIEVSGSNVLFALDGGYPTDMQIKNSTIWSKTKHTGFFIQAQGRPKDATGATSFSVDQTTLYKISSGKKANNNNSGIKGQSTTSISLTNSILVDFGSNVGNEVNGWLFGQNSTSPKVTYANNTYVSADGELVSGWTDDTKVGSDQSETAGTVVPQFKDEANGDFTQFATTAGDPRWTK